MPQINYVCTACSQTFTRKYSGMRHKCRTHNGTSEVVRLLDYIVGRVSGQYLASDPSWYRNDKVGQPTSDNSTSFGPATIPDTLGTQFRRPKLTQHKSLGNTSTRVLQQPSPNRPTQLETNMSNKTSGMPLSSSSFPPPPYHSPESQQAQHSLNDRVNEDDQASVHFDKVVERTSKLEELKRLLNKHYPPQYARHFFVCISYLSSQRMDDVLDERLRFVRDIDINSLNSGYFRQ